MPPSDVLAIMTLCGDPGGAEALAPVIKHLRGDRRLEIACFAYRNADRILTRHGLACHKVREADGEEELGRLFRQTAPAGVLVATSYNGVDLEKTLVKLARDAGVPSLALVDFWSRYRERFCDSAGALSTLPDRIAVMDEIMRAAMVAQGFDAARLCVTGQPALDALQHLRRMRRLRAVTRRRWGAGPGTFVALYASQPSRFDHDSGPVVDSGRAGLAMLVRALALFQRHRGRKVLLVLRPHPRQRRSPLTFGRRLVPARANDRSPRHAAALGCDAMFGKRTMLLVEAHALGVPAFSVQPLGARGEVGGVPQVRSAAALLRQIAASAAPGRRAPALERAASPAADRVKAILLDLLGLERASHA